MGSGRLDSLLRRIRYSSKAKGLVWVEPRNKRVKPGQLVGTPMIGKKNRKTNRLVISCKEGYFRVEELVWYWHYGELPQYEVGHHNNDTLDNRIENLYLTNKPRKRLFRDANTKGPQDHVQGLPGEAKLVAAIIRQAFKDLKREKKKNPEGYQKSEVYRFLTNQTGILAWYCDPLNLDIDYIRERAEKI